MLVLVLLPLQHAAIKNPNDTMKVIADAPRSMYVGHAILPAAQGEVREPSDAATLRVESHVYTR